jgi:unsaturated rhamnogalacturonyl hydrolase
MRNRRGTESAPRHSFPVLAPSLLLLPLVCLLLFQVADAQNPAEKNSAAAPNPRSGVKVTLDAWFNSQQRKNAAGQMEYFHYKWDDATDSGFSLFADIFYSFGVATDTLYSAPTLEKLKSSQLYIIVSPDIPARNPTPHYVQAEDAEQVAQWVKDGGVLVLMENDPANADIEHLNLLADHFGIHFDPLLRHHAIGDDIASGTIAVNGDGPVFFQPHIFFMKDTCAISEKSPAVVLLQDGADIVMATAKYGKGTVFAVVDPWLYNEYVDGHSLPPRYDNLAGGKELVRWLLQQIPNDRLPSPGVAR